MFKRKNDPSPYDFEVVLMGVLLVAGGICLLLNSCKLNPGRFSAMSDERTGDVAYLSDPPKPTVPQGYKLRKYTGNVPDENFVLMGTGKPYSSVTVFILALDKWAYTDYAYKTNEYNGIVTFTSDVAGRAYFIYMVIPE